MCRQRLYGVQDNWFHPKDMPNNKFRVWSVGGEGFPGLCSSFKLREITVPISYSLFTKPKLSRTGRIKNVAGTPSECNVVGHNLSGGVAELNHQPKADKTYRGKSRGSFRTNPEEQSRNKIPFF